mmetsp:Transcript_18046/g.54385  ORF Transcript_18046/g.54385 Transcript_18046/m.54385 type:complete len:582 (-) Transcript_18046:62-1807(-)
MASSTSRRVAAKGVSCYCKFIAVLLCIVGVFTLVSSPEFPRTPLQAAISASTRLPGGVEREAEKSQAGGATSEDGGGSAPNASKPEVPAVEAWQASLDPAITAMADAAIVVKELPDFWRPPPEADLDALTSEVGGEPTIFVGIASYRDALCHNTLNEALRWADHPRRLFFGVVEQNAQDDADELRCDYTPKPCKEDPSQPLCAHRGQIRLLRVDAISARGPCFGRHRADRLYRGEHYALQLDAHMYFVKGWDTKIIASWKETRNEYAVLSTYPSEYKGSITEGGESRLSSAPLICRSAFQGDGMVRHEAAQETLPDPNIVGSSPVLGPLWGAGISFSRGHRIVRVPYDCCLDMMFVGEEFSMAARMWTYGYDFYAPYPSVSFHPYSRPKRPHLFWENTGRAPGAGARSARRVLAMLGLPPEGGDYDASNIAVGELYGVGTRRPLKLFLHLFGYNLTQRRSRDNCHWVTSMSMHKDLVPYLRRDGKGIDYDRVPVQSLLDKHFGGGFAKCKFSGPVPGFLAGCAQACRRFGSLEEAQAECSRDGSCGGIVVAAGNSFELREAATVLPSPSGEQSYLKGDCTS